MYILYYILNLIRVSVDCEIKYELPLNSSKFSRNILIFVINAVGCLFVLLTILEFDCHLS